MADAQVSIRWAGRGLEFEADHPSGNVFRIDGNSGAAHSPVQGLLLALAGCSGADVVDIAARMRVPLQSLRVEVEGDRNAEAPRYFLAVRMKFIAGGVAAEHVEKVQRAIDLSQEKYCSVLHSLRPDMTITSMLELE